ncbi:hypothetical protein ABMA57_01555 [Saccharospirillum sp. HFRX-1]|uniref:hypothetical protein n=1 Tax=unclassified Saccharospirillum TaxID=2633430 RepID=UPI003710EFBC
MKRFYCLVLSLLLVLGACTQSPTLNTENDVIDRSLNGAVELVREYYADVNRGDYRRAYDRWGENGPPQQNVAAFAEQFADIRSIELSVGDDTFMEGAAGSIYANLPIQLNIESNDGSTNIWSGTAIVKRVNDVPGASDAQLRWHLYRLDLQPD